MLRVLSGGVFAVVLVFSGALVADEIKGKVKNVDADKSTITITVEDKDKTYNLDKDFKVVGLVGKKLKKAKLQDLPGGLTAVKTNAEVTLTTTKVEAKEVVSQIKVEGLHAKKRKKKNNN